MYSIVACDDTKIVADILSKCGMEYNHSDILNMILINEDKIIGASSSGITSDSAYIRSIGVLKDYRKQGFGDAISRATINKLSYISKKIEIKGVYQYFEKFGFKNKGEWMIADSEQLIFPSSCKGDL